MEEQTELLAPELEPGESPRSEDLYSIQSVSDEEASQGTKATRLFMNEEFAECLEVLQELAVKRPNDPRVLSNLAVCRYFSSEDYTRTDELTQCLFKTYKMLIDSYGGEFDADQGQEYCVLIYNLALTRLDVKNYAAAEQILSLLYNSSDSSSSASSSPKGGEKNQVSSDIIFALDQVLPLLISLNLYLKNSSKALTLLGKARPKVKQDLDPMAQQRLFLCHALALVQLKAFKSFKRDVKPNGLSTVNQITYEFLRANLEFAKGNARKAMKLLGLGIQQVTSARMNEAWIHYINSLYQNNLGCLHLLMKKPNLGVFYTSQATDSHTQALARMNKASPHFLLKMKRNEIIYNMAMNLLHAGQPATAFATLLQLLPALGSWSNYWLRLAECCINQQRKDEEIVSRLYSSPPWIHAKKVIIQTTEFPAVHLEKTVVKATGVKSVVPTITLDFATFCLKCAEKLLANSTIEKGNGSTESQNPSSNPPSGSSSPSKYTSSPSRSHLILLSIWSNLAYVNLCQGDFQAALENAEKVLQFDETLTPSGYKFLAHMYAAEATMKLGRPNDTVSLLDSKKLSSFGDVSFSEPSLNNHAEDVPISDQQVIAKVMLQINLAVAHIHREEINRAEDILERLATSAPPPHELSYKILSLRLYLSLSKGNVEKARELATRYFEDKLKEIQ